MYRKAGSTCSAFPAKGTIRGRREPAESTSVPNFRSTAQNGRKRNRSYEKEQPAAMPEHLEAGTLNVHGIAGLLGALEYLEKTGIEMIYKKREELMHLFLEKIQGIGTYFIWNRRSAAAGTNGGIKHRLL